MQHELVSSDSLKCDCYASIPELDPERDTREDNFQESVRVIFF